MSRTTNGSNANAAPCTALPTTAAAASNGRYDADRNTDDRTDEAIERCAPNEDAKRDKRDFVIGGMR